MKRTVAAAIAALAMQAPPAHAIKVLGMPSCGAWVAERSKPNGSWDQVAQLHWLVGYLSGIAVGKNRDILKGTDNESLYLWMDNWCRANPLKTLAEGGKELYLELAATR